MTIKNEQEYKAYEACVEQLHNPRLHSLGAGDD